MEMRKIVPLLMVAVAVFFDPATSDWIRDGKERTKQGSDSMPSCLQKNMAENYKAVDGIIEFLCSCMKYKDMTNKEELIKAIENLENVTGCSTEDIFGSGASLKQVALDENGVLTSQIIIMNQLLESLVILPITPTVCSVVKIIGKSPDFVIETRGDVQGNKRTTRDLLSLVGGVTGSLDGIAGLLNLLGLIGKVVKLLDPVLSLVGNLLDRLSGVTNIVGGLGSGLNGVTGLIGGLTEGLLGGGGKQGDLLGNLVGGVGGTLGGLTGVLGGLTGSVGQATQSLGGLTGGLGGLTGGLTGGGGGGSNLLGFLGR